MNFNLVVLPGDGIGPEVIDQGIKIIDAVAQQFSHRMTYFYDEVGGASIDKNGIALKQTTLNQAYESDAILFGAVGGPKWDDPKSGIRPEDAILAIRKRLGVFANIRPIKIFDALTGGGVLKPEVLDGVDIVVIRELTGGLYYGKPKSRRKTLKGWTGVDTLRYSSMEIRRVLRVGFELATSRNKHLTSVDKANVLETSRLWRQIALEMASEYPMVKLDHMLVDNCAMQLILRPSQFDVIVTENMFGDILTDEAAVLAASMGLLPSASLAGIPKEGEKTLGLYEPIHGTAPDIAGSGIANPIATILSAAMMMRYSLGLTKEANSVEKAVEQVIGSGYRTRDLMPRNQSNAGLHELTTEQMGDKIVKSLQESL